MGTAIKHPVPDRLKPSFVIFDIPSGHSGTQGWVSECPDVKNYKWQLNPVWLLYSCTHMATVGVKGLNLLWNRYLTCLSLSLVQVWLWLCVARSTPVGSCWLSLAASVTSARDLDNDLHRSSKTSTDSTSDSGRPPAWPAGRHISPILQHSWHATWSVQLTQLVVFCRELLYHSPCQGHTQAALFSSRWLLCCRC